MHMSSCIKLIISYLDQVLKQVVLDSPLLTDLHQCLRILWNTEHGLGCREVEDIHILLFIILQEGSGKQLLCNIVTEVEINKIAT